MTPVFPVFNFKTMVGGFRAKFMLFFWIIRFFFLLWCCDVWKHVQLKPVVDKYGFSETCLPSVLVLTSRQSLHPMFQSIRAKSGGQHSLIHSVDSWVPQTGARRFSALPTASCISLVSTLNTLSWVELTVYVETDKLCEANVLRNLAQGVWGRDVPNPIINIIIFKGLEVAGKDPDFWCVKNCKVMLFICPCCNRTAENGCIEIHIWFVQRMSMSIEYFYIVLYFCRSGKMSCMQLGLGQWKETCIDASLDNFILLLLSYHWHQDFSHQMLYCLLLTLTSTD